MREKQILAQEKSKKLAYLQKQDEDEKTNSAGNAISYDIQAHMRANSRLNWPHQNGKIGQMIALASGISLVRLDQTTPTIRPTMNLVVPEDTHGLFEGGWILEMAQLDRDWPLELDVPATAQRGRNDA